MKQTYALYLQVLVLAGILSLFCTNDSGTNIPGSSLLFSDDTIAVKNLPWPQPGSKGLFPCINSPENFDEPDLPVFATGITLEPSALLQPVGYVEKVALSITLHGSAQVDTSYNGTVAVEAGPHAVVRATEPVIAGKATVTVRFTAPGVHRLAVTTTMDDNRSGEVSIMAFMPQLPVYEMNIDDNDLREIIGHPYDKILVPATLTINGTLCSTSVRIHGGASRDYPKKSFRFDLKSEHPFTDIHDHIILRAEWNDKTMLRNYLGLEMARNGTWLTVPDAEPVHFRVNNRYYGVMWRVERIDGDFLRLREINTKTGSLYEADPADACASPGGNLTPLATADEYRCVYTRQKGIIDYTDLTTLIEETLLLDDDTFSEQINDVVSVNDMLVYFAVMAIMQNHDHLKKNYYLYRDPDSNDDRWTIVPCDLELTFGHLWTEAFDVLDEDIFTEEPLDFGANNSPTNALFTRLYAIPDYRKRFDAMVEHLLANVFTTAFVNERIDNFLCRATPDIIADRNKRATNSEYLDRVMELRTFVEKRRRYISEKSYAATAANFYNN